MAGNPNKRQKTLDYFVRSTSIPAEKINVSPETEPIDVIEDLEIATDKSCNIISENDIGLYIGNMRNISDLKKKEMLENPFSPPRTFTYPYSEHKMKDKVIKRYLNVSHFDKYSWLVFSPTMKGVFCKYCSLFAPVTVGEGKCGVEAGILVSKPLKSFLKLLGKDGILEKHQRNKYHTNSIQTAKDFLYYYNKPQNEICNILSSHRLKQVEENRKRLIPIIDTIITLGRQNIAYRGHRDDGDLVNNESITNGGNFREILKLRIRGGDTNLQNHLKSAPHNATYISKTTQNYIIECCGEEIINHIKERMVETKYYSVIFDETTDISTISQISIVLRYLQNGKIREDFIGFFDLHDMNYGSDFDPTCEPKIDGVRLGNSVVKILEKNNINVGDCIGICTDTCSIMTSELRGAVTQIQKFAPNASRIPCFNHAFNLSLSKCVGIQFVRNCFGTMKEIVTFFHSSSKKNFALKNILGSKLGKLCDTRWVERHDVSMDFERNIIFIIKTLENIETWKDGVASSKANIFINSLTKTEFLVSLRCITYIFSKTVILSNFFQNKSADIISAIDIIKDLLEILKENRNNADDEFQNIWKETSVLAEKLEVDLKFPRVASNQSKQANYLNSTPEEYYKRNIFIPMLDEIISDISFRFDEDTLNSFFIQILLPKNLLNANNKNELKLKLSKLWSKYKFILKELNGGSNSESYFMSEVELWKVKCIRENNIGNDNLIDIYKSCDKDIYPNCEMLLRLLLSLPISVASAERSFSGLRRIKTWLRNQMGEDRLLGLSLLHMHWDIHLDPEKILDRFAKSKNRKLDFIL